jgi:hypothetical protein
LAAKRLGHKNKIERILDWLTDNGDKDYRVAFIRWISPPARRTYREIEEWLHGNLEEVGLTLDPPVTDILDTVTGLVFKVYVSDIVRWKEKNETLLTGALATKLQEKQGEWLGVNPYIALNSVLGQVSELTQRYYDKLKESEEPNYKEVLVLEKLSARAALTAEAIAALDTKLDKQEVGLGYAYQLATDVKALANLDPNATPKMREWVTELLSAAIAKMEEQSK